LKTLILNGSTRKNGDVQALVEAFIEGLCGEAQILTAGDNISPCLDCRRCWEHPGCCIQDAMQKVYPYLVDCDIVALASPIWFSSLSGPLLNMASRFQTYFAGHFFRGEKDILKPKSGVLLLAGAEPGTEKKPVETAHSILKHINACSPLRVISSMCTNQIPARNDNVALTAARDAAKALNQQYN
jgi:multimeric flavodoxin WrbA